MAAQEKTKAAAAPPQTDVRGPPPGIQTVAAAPPAYNAGLFVPPVTEQQPPAFDFIEDDQLFFLTHNSYYDTHKSIRSHITRYC